MEHTRRGGHLWSIILAGGDGIRTQPFIRRWLGEEKPKQYCTFVGTRSMLQHTVDRAAMLTPPERIVVVAAHHHQHEVWRQLEGRSVGMVLLQPKNVNTGAGVFLPLTYIRARDPQATVIIHPSDHFVHPEDQFLLVVEQAVWATKWLLGRPILLAAAPDNLELEYGWIKPGRYLAWSGTYPVRAVESFIEKPDESQAYSIRHAGGLWNTLIMAADAERLWDLGWRCFPEMMRLFRRLKEGIDTAEEWSVLKSIYAAMPTLNFSSDLLQCAPERLAVMEMSGVLWSDWGKPERVAASLRKIGKVPAFEEELAALRET